MDLLYKVYKQLHWPLAVTWTIPKIYSWGGVTKVPEIESEALGCGLQCKRQNPYTFSLFFTHPSLAFDFVARRDPSHEDRSIVTLMWGLLIVLPVLRCSLLLSAIASPRELTFTWLGCYGLCQRHKSTDLAHSFLFCSCVCFSLMAISTVFHSINSSDNSPFSHSVLPVLSLPYWSF